MQTFTLTKKQFIAKVFYKRIDKNTKEQQFIDQNDNLILELLFHWPQQKDQFGRYTDDSQKIAIFEGNFLRYWACERHENHLHDFNCMPTNGERIY